MSSLPSHASRMTRQARPPLLYRMTKAGLNWPLHAVFRVDVQGLEHVPDGPAILAANHRSFMDSVFLALASPRPIAFMAKAEYFEHPVTRWMFRNTGQIPLRRGSPTSAREAVAAASAVLANGGLVGIYPEGTRSLDGKLHRGNLGPARLAAASGAPIIPIGLVGTEDVQKPSERLPHLFRSVSVKFGTPRRVPADLATGKEHLRTATDTVMQDIATLSDQEYIDRKPAPIDAIPGDPLSEWMTRSRPVASAPATARVRAVRHSTWLLGGRVDP